MSPVEDSARLTSWTSATFFCSRFKADASDCTSRPSAIVAAILAQNEESGWRSVRATSPAAPGAARPSASARRNRRAAASRATGAGPRR